MIKEDGLPVGLGFGLAMNEKALGQFSMMTEAVSYTHLDVYKRQVLNMIRLEEKYCFRLEAAA